MINKKLIFGTILGTLVIISMLYLVSAETQSLGTFKQNACIILKQTCANCTFVNVTGVFFPNSSQALPAVVMTKNGSEYTTGFCNTKQLGEYIYNTLGDPNGVQTVQPVSFTITSSGLTGLLGLSIILITVIYAITLFGFFGKHIWVATIGGMGMIFLGIYTFNNGIDIFRNIMTDAFSIITIGLGGLVTLTGLVEFIQDNI